MKKVLIGLVLLIIILVPVLLIAPSFFAWNDYKPQIKEQVAAYTGLDVDIAGDIKIALLPSPYAYVSDVSVRNPESGSNEPFVQLGRLDLVLKVAPLLSGQVGFSSIELVKPVISLSQKSNGSWNWETEKIKAMTNNDKEAGQPSEAQQSGNFDLSLDHVEIQDGSFVLAQSGKAPTEIKNVNVTVSANSMSGPFSAKGALQAQGQDIEFEATSGRITPESKAFPLNAEVKVKSYGATAIYSGVLESGDKFALQGQTKILVDDVNKASGGAADLPSEPLSVSGLLTVTPETAEYKNMAITYGDNAFEGAVSLSEGYSVAKIDLKSSKFNLYPKISSVALNGIFAISDSLYQARSLKAQVDNMTISGDVSYVTGTRGNLKADLQLGALDLNKFAASTGSSKKLTAQDVKDMVKPLALPFDAKIKVSADSVKQGDAVYKNVSVSASVKDKFVTLENLSVGDYLGTSIAASGKVADISALSGLDAKVSVKADDFSKLAELAKFDMSTLPAGVKGGSVALQYAGSIDAGKATVNIGAMNGQVIASGDVSDPIETLGLSNLAVQVKHPNTEQLVKTLSGQPTGFTSLDKPLDFYAKIDKTAMSASLSDVKATIGTVPLSGELKVDGLDKKPNLTGDLRFGRVVLTTAANNKSRATTGWSNDPINTDALHAFDMDVKFSAESLQYNTWNMDAPKGQMTLKDGVFAFKDFTAGMYSGQVFLDANVNAPKGGAITMNSKAQIRGVSLEPLITSFTGGKILQGSGLIDLDASVESSGKSQAALVQTLKGSGVTTGEKIILEGFDLKRFGRAMSSDTKPGDTALGLWKTATKGGTTQFDTMDGAFTVQNGMINLTKLDLDGTDALLNMTGTVDLQKWYLDSQAKITIKENDGATPPFTIKIAGPLDNPANTLGQGILEDYLSRKVQRKVQDVLQDKLGDKLGGFGGLLGGGAPQQQAPANDNSAADGTSKDQESQPQQQQQADPAQEAINGLIKGLLK